MPPTFVKVTDDQKAKVRVIKQRTSEAVARSLGPTNVVFDGKAIEKAIHEYLDAGKRFQTGDQRIDRRNTEIERLHALVQQEDFKPEQMPDEIKAVFPRDDAGDGPGTLKEGPGGGFRVDRSHGRLG